ncbi:MAG: hypothetical protein WD425_18360 [Nitrospirales bacterium]
MVIAPVSLDAVDVSLLLREISVGYSDSSPASFRYGIRSMAFNLLKGNRDQPLTSGALDGNPMMFPTRNQFPAFTADIVRFFFRRRIWIWSVAGHHDLFLSFAVMDLNHDEVYQIPFFAYDEPASWEFMPSMPLQSQGQHNMANFF